MSFKAMSRSLLVLSIALYMAGMATSASSPTDFIKVHCKATRYPALCIESLVRYASEIQRNEHHLAVTALSVSLARARSAALVVNKLSKVRGIKPRELEAVKDCVENMGDSVDRLSVSIKELGIVGKDFGRHMSNVKTWVSAALTDENTCLDGFEERSFSGIVKAAIKRRVSDVARVTSNALGLVNHYASRHCVAESSCETQKP